MKPIIHVVYDCIPGAFAGGVQKMVFELASAQRRAGANVEVWTVNALRAGSTEHHGGLPIRNFMPDPALGLVRSDRLAAALLTLDGDCILHGHNSFQPLNLHVAAAVRQRGFTVYYHPHGALDPTLFADWSWGSLKKRIYIHFFSRVNLSRATGVFALTSREQLQLRAVGITSPIMVVPNGIDAVEWQELPLAESAHLRQTFRAQQQIPAHAQVLLFIGRINPKKRLEDIIGAFARLAPDHPALFLAIAGQAESEYFAALQAQVAAAGLTARVRWVGFLNENTKPAAFAGADYFIHASISEGMALAILEAMAHGLPVVATKGCYMHAAAAVGALSECAQGPEALATALAPFIASPAAAQAQGEAGRRYVREVHDWDRLARQYLQIYAEGPPKA